MPDLHYVCVCMTISQIPQKLLVTQSPGCGLLAKLRPLGPPPPRPALHCPSLPLTAVVCTRVPLLLPPGVSAGGQHHRK